MSQIDMIFITKSYLQNFDYAANLRSVQNADIHIHEFRYS